MKESCRNHPDRKALSFCHACGLHYCAECLREGGDYYYCYNEKCQPEFQRAVTDHPFSRTESSSGESVLGNINELEKVANYRMVRKLLRPAGIGSMIFGAFALLQGISSIEDNPINLILALIGGFLFLEGIWVLRYRTAKGLLIDGIALMVVGLWNIPVSLFNISQGSGGGHNLFIGLGVWQIFWGIQNITRYERFSGVSLEKPSEEALKRLDDIVKGIRRAKAKDHEAIIEFQAKTFPIPQSWKGKLFDDMAIFIDRGGAEVLLSDKETTHILNEGKVWAGKSMKASLRETYGVKSLFLT